MSKCTPAIKSYDDYLLKREGKYEWRAVRYRKAIKWLFKQGLNNNMTIFDVGAGMTEFDYCLRKEFDWRGRYIPVDGSICGVDLNDWIPPREAHFCVGLEIIEHLHNWEDFVKNLQSKSTCGVVLSTPNPNTTDVLEMDATHCCEIFPEQLSSLGFSISEEMFYGGVFSNGDPDALFATWKNKRTKKP